MMKQNEGTKKLIGRDGGWHRCGESGRTVDGGRCRLGGRERASPAGGEREARWCRCEGGRTAPTREERGDGGGQGERNDDVGVGEEG
jgi:hypothetical protein